MAQISIDLCPHCFTKRVAFEGNQYRPGKPNSRRHLMLMQCQVCREGIVAVFDVTNSNTFSQWAGGQQSDPGAVLLGIFPKPVTQSAPEHLPDNVGRFYLQGMDNLQRNFDAAGTMFRKALDTALKHLAPEAKGTLEKRIDTLDPATGVTPAMKKWAHEIRTLGNDAAHEDDPFTAEEAKALQAFTEMFLRYVFTLPGMLSERKAASAATAP